jgi:hypothetical protein
MTTGILEVALFTARVSGVEVVTITSTFASRRARTRPGRRSGLPSASVSVVERLRPST